MRDFLPKFCISGKKNFDTKKIFPEVKIQQGNCPLHSLQRRQWRIDASGVVAEEGGG